MVRQSLVLWAVALALGTATLSAAPAVAAESATIQAVLNSDGSGRMVANSQTNPSDETWFWEACSPDLSSCAPFGTGRIVDTTGAPAGTVFRVTSSYGATTLSPIWHGNVASQAPPSVSGVVRANELVTPIPGQWRGGWEGDLDFTQLAACTSQADDHCTTLTDDHYNGGCSNGAAVLDPYFTGRYLRVADWRIGPHPISTLEAHLSPYGDRIWPADVVTAVAFVGRIAPPTGPRKEACGPPPLVRASISNKGVAKVRCGLGCHAVLIAKRGPHRARLSRKLPPTPIGSTRKDVETLRLPASSVARLGAGRVRMIVKVDGEIAARRTVRLS